MIRILAVLAALALALTLWASPAYRWRVLGQHLAASPIPTEAPRAEAAPEAAAVLRAAEAQLGQVVGYDPAYIRLDFPMGDVDPASGVCTDVVIRALRRAHGIDLQALVHADMRAHFGDYPGNWGLSAPDPNIDHRRVPNLSRFLERMGAAAEGRFRPGDIVTSLLPGNLTHIAIVSDRIGPSGDLMIIHNIGAGARVEDRLHEFELTGHYRLTPDVLQRLKP